MGKIEEKIAKYLVNEGSNPKQKAEDILRYLLNTEEKISDGYGYYSKNWREYLKSATKELLKAKSLKDVERIMDNYLDQLTDGPQYYGNYDIWLEDLYDIIKK